MTRKRLSCILLVLVLLSSSVLIQSLVSVGVTQEVVGWLADWQYRKGHNITGSTAGDQTNYPVLLSVRYSSGFDVAGEVYLSGKCRSDFGDIRFTDSSGVSLLDYWMQEKTDGVQALFWAKLNYIAQHPDKTPIYIYYGNANASTTSNEDWTFNFATDFEDETTEGWTISWTSTVTLDGVSTSAFEGNFSRIAGRRYGSGDGCGNGDFYERFQNTAYLPPGSYRMEGAARFADQNSYVFPRSIKFLVDGVAITEISSPGTTWQWLRGNFTISTGSHFALDVEFHLFTTSNLISGGEFYSIDSVFIRKWCDPEPTHDSWGTEEEFVDDTEPPEILSVEWIPTCPHPYVPSSEPRQGEPILIKTQVNDGLDGSGVNTVGLCYRIDSSAWWNVSMHFNATEDLYTAMMPGQIGNTTIQFFITATDNAENTNTSEIYNLHVKPLPIGDLNGDSTVNMKDIGRAASNFGETYP